MKTIRIRDAAPYDIHIGSGVIDNAEWSVSTLRGRHALIVSDTNIAPLYANRVEDALKRAKPEIVMQRFVLPAGERSKTLAVFADCIDALAALGATRDACIYALGGGVVGDLAGFAAACWMRGIDYVQMPTSLLAMVDASVGGKTAIDLPQGKNLVGAFHSPRAVLIDPTVLRTLPLRELRTGLAEVVKYAAIADAGFFDWLENHVFGLLSMDEGLLIEAIERSCSHKAAIVESDPKEHGARALLNFGHTFGHAIEAVQGYGAALNHGEAVAIGMVLATELSERLGLAGAAERDRLRTLLGRIGLPTQLPDGLDPESLLARMRLDKKATKQGLRFVLWEGIGKGCVRSGIAEAVVSNMLRNA